MNPFKNHAMNKVTLSLSHGSCYILCIKYIYKCNNYYEIVIYKKNVFMGMWYNIF